MRLAHPLLLASLVLVFAACTTASKVDQASLKPIEADAVFTGNWIDATQADELPVATLRTVPRYPWGMRVNEITGGAMVDFIVDVNGRPTQVQCTKATAAAFGEAAVAAVCEWRYRPGTKDGAPVAVRMQQYIDFALGE